MRNSYAYCFASGHIEIGTTIPDGALPLMIEGPAEKVRDFVNGVARHGYQTEDVNGRRQRIPGTDCLLVPGIPEAPDQHEALNALQRFNEWIAPAARRAGLQGPRRSRRARS